MSIRTLLENCILEFANIIEDNKKLQRDVDDLYCLADEYEQFIGEMGLEDEFLARQYGNSLDAGFSNNNRCYDYDDYDGWGYPRGYGTTSSYYDRYYGGYCSTPKPKQLKPGEIDAAALKVGITKILYGQQSKR